MILLSSVLVATDFGKASESALEYGRNLARAFGGNLHVLHVVGNVMEAAGAEVFPSPEVQEQVENAARSRLGGLLTDEDRLVLYAKPVVRNAAQPADAIIRYAKEAHVDLIVVGTHGRGAVAHFFLGSVAETVARSAPCPVLVVHPNEHEFIVPDPVSAASRI